jgi:hypothetical protein
MRIVETPVYDFTELSDAAKDKARVWFRETIDYDWWDSGYDDFEQICAILGVTLATSTVRLMVAPPARSPASGFPGSGRRATAPVSRAVMPMPRARRFASATMRPWTRSCTGLPMRCRRCRG